MNKVFQMLRFYVALNVFALSISDSKSNYSSLSG